MGRENYSYLVCSRRRGNLPEASVFVKDMLQLLGSFSETETRDELLEIIQYGIAEEWAGVILATLGRSLVGFLSFNIFSNTRTADVGFAAVHTNHWMKGIWTYMSLLVEQEARSMGAKKIRRHISFEDEFLADHLERNGYKPESRDGNWKTDPLVKRLNRK